MTTPQLSYFRFSRTQITRPDWTYIANRLNLPENIKADLNTHRNNKKGKDWKKAVKQTKLAIENKYEYETTRVSQSWKYKYTYRFKKDKKTKIFKGERNGTIIGTNADIEKLLQEEIEADIDILENDSPIEIVKIEPAQYSARTNVPLTTGGRLVVKGVRTTKMRDGKVYQLDKDYLGDESWNTNTGKCVFDWIYHIYSKLDGFKKIMRTREDCYEYLDNCFTDIVQYNCPRAIDVGVSVEELKSFCKKHNVPMYAFDRFEKLIEHYKPEKRSAYPPLIFIVANQHFYPIVEKRTSFTAKARNEEMADEEKLSWKSDDIATEFENTTTADEIVIADEKTIHNDYAIDIIHSLNKLPEPKSIRISSGKIMSFKIGNTKYFTEPVLDDLVEYCDEVYGGFKGQSIGSILKEIETELDNLDIEVDEEAEEVEEKEQNVYSSKSRLSKLAPQVLKYLTAEGVKYRTHYGNVGVEGWDYTQIPEWVKNGDAVIVDIAKCYSACMYDPYDNWIRYDCEDQIEIYRGQPLETGLYFVETNDLSLLHQSNWYSNKILELAKQENIQFKITHQLIHKKNYSDEPVLPKDYLRPLLELIQEKTQGKGLYKLLNNTITGLLGKTDRTEYKAEVSTDPEEVWRCFLSCETPDDEGSFDRLFYKPDFEESKYQRWRKDNVIIQNLNDSEGRNIYLYGFERKTKDSETSLPMYIQILDWSNMRLYNMCKKLGGQVLYRKTDEAVIYGGKKPEPTEITNIYEEWGTYREVDILDVATRNWGSSMRTDRHIKAPEIKDAWNIYPNNDSDDWKAIIDLAFEKGGLLIEGRAGTGKSYIPKSAMGKTDFTIPYKLIPEKVKSMSFTNKASRGIFGTTIHKTFKIDKNTKTQSKTIQSLFKYDVVVIDEIGMISNALWNIVKLLKLAKPSIVFILMGDWRQLPPVEPTRLTDVDIFNHPVVKFLTKCNKIELTIRKRYDKELWDFLERGFNDDDWSGLPTRPISYDECYVNKNIVFFNKTRDIINDMCMDYFKDQADYSIHIPFNRTEDNDKPKSIYVYEGLPLMSYKNNTKLGIVNSDEFVVNNFDDDTILLNRIEGGDDVEIKTTDIHKLFVCNYASTAHKSQGATYHSKVFLWDFNYMINNRQVAYTACSRATKLENLVVADGFEN